MAITRSAPMSWAPRWAMRPTPPHPHTAIVSPPLGSAKSAPMNPVGAASERNRACSSRTFSGTVAVEEVQIRAAGRREPDLEDRVVGVDDRGVVDGLRADVVDPVPADRAHRRPLDPVVLARAGGGVPLERRHLTGLEQGLRVVHRLD